MKTQKMPVLRAFGNDLEAVVNDVVLPLAMSRLRTQLTMPKLISVDNTDESKQVGDTVRVPKPVIFDAADEHGAESSASSLKVEKVDVKLDRHIYKEFRMSDKEFTGSQPGTIPDALAAAVDVLAREVNASIFALGNEVATFSGDLSSTNARDKKDLIAARRKMNDLGIVGERTMVLTGDTEADLLGIFTTGSDQKAEQEGQIGRRFGFDVYSDVQAPIHYAGTASEASLTLGVASAAGARVVTLSGFAGETLLKGDIVTFAGVDGGFAVASAEINGADALVTFANAVPVAMEAGTVAVVAGDHPLDLAFHKAAFLIAFRQLETPESTPGTTIGSMTDPETGITLRLLSWYNPSTESTHWKIETLFGCKAVAPERAMRVGGH